MNETTTTLARSLAPEEIRPGTYVSVLHEVKEFLPWACQIDPALSRPEPVSVRWLPEDEPEPLRVLEVCLPFVLVQRPRGRARTLDVRRVRLAGLSESYGETAFKRLRRRRKKRKAEEPKNSEPAE